MRICSRRRSQEVWRRRVRYECEEMESEEKESVVGEGRVADGG
jgi:hypothetical protein